MSRTPCFAPDSVGFTIITSSKPGLPRICAILYVGFPSPSFVESSTLDAPMRNAVTSAQHVKLPAILVTQEPRRVFHEVNVGPLPPATVVLRIDQTAQCPEIDERFGQRALDPPSR